MECEQRTPEPLRCTPPNPVSRQAFWESTLWGHFQRGISPASELAEGLASGFCRNALLPTVRHVPAAAESRVPLGDSDSRPCPLQRVWGGLVFGDPVGLTRPLDELPLVS
jgi:hypothetical protein